MEATIIRGGKFADERGVVTFNNDFNSNEIKRIYFIENPDLNFVRGWQGHKVEQRWFSVVKGSFNIELIKIDHWDCPSRSLASFKFNLNSSTFDVLHVPGGYISSIQATEPDSKLMAMSDYALGAIQDEYRFSIDYFKDIK